MKRAALASLALAVLPAVSSAPAHRTFDFTYSAVVHDIPAGAHRVAIWVPYPVSDPHQKVSRVEVSCPFPTKVETDPEYGNHVLSVVVENPKGTSVPLTVAFDVDREEYLRKGFAGAKSGAVRPPKKDRDLMKRWLEPDRLVPLDRRIRDLSAQVTEGKSSPLEKARAIYGYVVSTMKYDKSGEGWGNGDIYWACDAKRGNCTDFHALFVGLCRAAGIPARFSIGFPLPSERGGGEIAGYHCWAEFWLDGYGWVPVDASEASKHPDRKDYFFGAHDENRVQLSMGRDIVLAPKQAGAPLNYFVYPYVEVDGKPFKDVTKTFRFKDVTGGQVSH
jgi:transglutaminase-like putative cysteine protease